MVVVFSNESIDDVYRKAREENKHRTDTIHARFNEIELFHDPNYRGPTCGDIRVPALPDTLGVLGSS